MTLLTLLEIIATTAGLTHVYLLTREKIIAWTFGIVTVAIYVYIFFVSKLYSDAILHVFYIFINAFGWYNWARRKGDAPVVQITRLTPSGLGVLAAMVFSGTFAWGWLMDTRTDADFAYFDAFIAVASLAAQFLLTRKKIDNWAIWISVDLVAIPIYLLKGLHVTTALYFVYLVLCISGMIEWKKSMRR
jgi:nicotinamide mononucleotide transporter